MSEDLGYGSNSAGPRNYWNVPKAYDPKSMMICKKKEITAQYLQGRLLDISAVEGEYEGNTTYQLQVTLEGSVNNIFQCGRYSLLGRDIILKLASVEKIDYVRIMPFESVMDDGKKLVRCSVRAAANKSGLENPATKLQSAFTKEEIPEVKEVMVNKKVVYDTGARDEFIDNLIPFIKSKISGTTYVPEPSNSRDVEVEVIEEDKF
jgi:hypothetical protein